MTDFSRHTDQKNTVSSIGERALIERIRARAGSPSDWITTGIGDDAAVMKVPRGEVLVSTVDALVEGVHFRRDWSSPHSVGRKAIAVSLSDIAAMGAKPLAVLASLSIPAELPAADFDAVVDGIVHETRAHGASLVGGNIATSPHGLALHITALGSAHPRRLLPRSGGRPGDGLYVTGSVGAAAAALQALQHEGPQAVRAASDLTDCLSRYETPSPLMRCGRWVASHRAASACIDLSDGLADAARQLATASKTGVVIDAALVPIHQGAARWFEGRGLFPLDAALAGGEDYELLFAVPARKRRAFLAAIARSGGITATKIGELTKGSGCVVRRGNDSFELPQGFSHLG